MFSISTHQVVYCPHNKSIVPVWINSGLSQCFMDTVTSSYFLCLMILGSIQVLIFWRKAVRWRSEDLPSPVWFRIQILVSIMMICQYIARVVVHGVLGPKPLPGYLELSTCFCLASYIVSILVLCIERARTMEGNTIKGHGALLLLFWTGAFINENLSIISWQSSFYWWSLESKLDQADFSLWVGRYVITLSLFVMGLKAPGLPPSGYQLLVNTNGDYVSQTRQPTSVSDSPSTWSSVMKKMQMVWPYVWPKGYYVLQIRILVCMMLLIAGRITNVFIPIVNKNIIDDLNGGIFPWHLILINVFLKLCQGGGFGGLGFLNNFRTFLWIRVQQFTTKGIMVRLFSHLHSLSLSWHLNRKIGEVLRKMERGTQSISHLLSYVVFNILPTVCDIFIAIVYFITSFNAWFGLIVFVAMSFYLVITILITEWRTKYRRGMNLAENRKKQKEMDSLLNFETVKYYGNEQFEVDTYSTVIDEYQTMQWKMYASLNILNTAQNLVINSGFLIGCVLCAYMVVDDNHKLTVGDYVLFSTYIMQLYAPLNFFGTYYRIIQQAFIDMENMIDLLEEKPDFIDEFCDQDLVISHGTVEFDKVSFYFNKRKPILKDVSFKVEPGQTVALVGPSGAGKSTIIRLLVRFYEIQEGCIRIDGQDIRTVTQKSLRKYIGVVPQDTVLFNDKIKYNIRYGKIDCSDEELESAAAAADIHARICNFSDGYDTVVGERGLKLSGGEKQRVAIARTILKAPEIVLLDEATSALDTKTERNIQTSLSAVCQNRTTLIVAHRLSSIIHSDQILVLQDGMIIERGRHDELLEDGGVYYEMWSEQLNAQEMNGDEGSSSGAESYSQKMD